MTLTLMKTGVIKKTTGSPYTGLTTVYFEDGTVAYAKATPFWRAFRELYGTPARDAPGTEVEYRLGPTNTLLGLGPLSITAPQPDAVVRVPVDPINQIAHPSLPDRPRRSR